MRIGERASFTCRLSGLIRGGLNWTDPGRRPIANGNQYSISTQVKSSVQEGGRKCVILFNALRLVWSVPWNQYYISLCAGDPSSGPNWFQYTYLISEWSISHLTYFNRSCCFLVTPWSWTANYLKNSRMHQSAPVLLVFRLKKEQIHRSWKLCFLVLQLERSKILGNNIIPPLQARGNWFVLDFIKVATWYQCKITASSFSRGWQDFFFFFCRSIAQRPTRHSALRWRTRLKQESTSVLEVTTVVTGLFTSRWWSIPVSSRQALFKYAANWIRMAWFSRASCIFRWSWLFSLASAADNYAQKTHFVRARGSVPTVEDALAGKSPLMRATLLWGQGGGARSTSLYSSRKRICQQHTALFVT